MTKGFIILKAKWLGLLLINFNNNIKFSKRSDTITTKIIIHYTPNIEIKLIVKKIICYIYSNFNNTYVN